MKFNVITGLPRSGSTLLCNLLNQNTAFYASSTSPLVSFLSGVSSIASNSPEFKSMLSGEPGTETRLEAVLRGMVESWYAERSGVVFDKSRGWAHNSLLLKKLYPDAKIIVCVRDLRNVFASIEKRHRDTAILDLAANPVEKTIEARATGMFALDGIIGLPLNGIADLMQRRPKGLVLVQYEHLTEKPEQAMAQLYRDMGEELFEHDFDSVPNAATDDDSHYLGKFPHETRPKVEPSDRDGWKEYVSPEIAGQIMGQFQRFNRAFGYV